MFSNEGGRGALLFMVSKVCLSLKREGREEGGAETRWPPEEAMNRRRSAPRTRKEGSNDPFSLVADDEEKGRMGRSEGMRGWSGWMRQTRWDPSFSPSPLVESPSDVRSIVSPSFPIENPLNPPSNPSIHPSKPILYEGGREGKGGDPSLSLVRETRL